MTIMSSYLRQWLTFLKEVAILLYKETSIWLFSKSEAKSVRDAVILITGGGRGIGKQLALQFALHKPAHVVLWGRSEESLEETARAIRRLNVNCSYMLCDVSNKEQIYSCAQELKAKFGEVSILVNNAGVVIGNSILEGQPDDVQYTFNVNTFSHMWCLKAFLPDMLANNRGHIVIINSVLGLLGIKGASDYSSSKFASLGLADSLRQELLTLGSNVKVTSIHPYQVDNDMFAGMSTRLSSFFPPLSERYVAECAVDAVLREKTQILLPRIMYLVYFFNSLMPVSVSEILNKAFGVDKAMDKVTKSSSRTPTTTPTILATPGSLSTMTTTTK